MRRSSAALIAAACLLATPPAPAQEAPRDELAARVERFLKENEDLTHRLDELAKAVDDVAFFQRLGDVAVVDKWRIVGPPDANPRNPQGPGATNPVKFYTYTFVPKDRKAGEKLPLVVLPHGGVHADFTTYHTHILRELLAQGYAVVAPDYRGSTGYGRGFWELIDYGGREVDDAVAARDWALESFDFLDPARVGVVGWSHGGLIALLGVMHHPEKFACAFAGVPVSDLVARLGYHDRDYEDLFSAPYHVGRTVREDIEEYKRRSPVWHVEKLRTPLLVHTTTNDEDVNLLEVEHLIQALKAAGKGFEHRVWTDAPGGHSFDRLDTPLARSIRQEIYAFLARHLKPPRRR